MLKPIKDSYTFLRYLLPFQRYKHFKYFTLKSSSWSRSTIFAVTLFDGKCYNLKRIPRIFTLDLTVSEILTFEMLDLQKEGQDHRVQFLH